VQIRRRCQECAKVIAPHTQAIARAMLRPSLTPPAARAGRSGEHCLAFLGTNARAVIFDQNDDAVRRLDEADLAGPGMFDGRVRGSRPRGEDSRSAAGIDATWPCVANALLRLSSASYDRIVRKIFHKMLHKQLLYFCCVVNRSVLTLRRDSCMAQSQDDPKVADKAPSDDALTPYDSDHLVTYLRLLDAESEGANWAEVARIVLGMDPEQEPERARGAWESHLERAKWMTTHGYTHLVRRGSH
jgi:hypothetical protein